MNKDIRLSVAFFNNYKTKKLHRIIGADGVIALLKLWIHTAVNTPDGKLSGYKEIDIEIAADWNGQEGRFVDALLSVGFLDAQEDGSFVIHDWKEHNEFASHAPERSAKAKKAIAARWSRKNSKSDCENIPNNTQSNTETYSEYYSKNTNSSQDNAFSVSSSPSISDESKSVSCSDLEKHTVNGSGIEDDNMPNNTNKNTKTYTEYYSETKNDTRSNTPSPIPIPSPIPNKLKNTTSSEPQNGSEPEVSPEDKTVTVEIVPILKIPLVSKDKKTGEHMEFSVIQDDLDNWIDSFPAVDVLQELKKLREWNRANPEKRKTPKGIRSHIVKWLTKAQDKGGGNYKNNIGGNVGRMPNGTISGSVRMDSNIAACQAFIRGD